jgi:hypothetical protein
MQIKIIANANLIQRENSKNWLSEYNTQNKHFCIENRFGQGAVMYCEWFCKYKNEACAGSGSRALFL